MDREAPDAADTAPAQAREEQTAETRPGRREPEPVAEVIARVITRVRDGRGA